MTMNNAIEWFKHISSSSWQNFWAVVAGLIGAFVTIIGIKWTLSVQENKDRQDRKDKIKPVIFVKLTDTESTISDEQNGIFEYFQMLTYLGNGFSRKANNLEFTLYVQCDYPAKNIQFMEFEISDDNNRLMNDGSDIKTRSVFDESSSAKKLWNFSKVETNIDWQREPLTVFKNDSGKLNISVFGRKALLNIFLGATYQIPQEISLKYFSSFIPVTARFSYQDIDNNSYSDLTIKFFVGLTIEDDFVIPIINPSSPFVDNPLVEKFIDYQVNKEFNKEAK